MTTSNAYKILIIGLLSIIVIAILPTLATVHHQTEASLSLILAQSSNTQVVPAAAFIQSADQDPTIDSANNWFFNVDDGSITSDSAVDRVCLVAPVYLPTNSQIESFTAYVLDESASDNLTIFLDKTDFFSVWQELTQVTSSNQAGITPLTTSTISTDRRTNIVSAEATYHVTFCLPANSGGSIKFYGAQINYLPPDSLTNSYLPIVVKPATATPPPIPPTTLIVTNQTGGPLTYTIFDTPIGTIMCEIPDGRAEVCGESFPAGTYSFKATAHCGQKVGERTYKPGQDALTPFRCS